MELFMESPEVFYKFASIFLADKKPTLSHHFCKMLHEKGLLSRYLTSNIDNLEESVNLPDHLIYQSVGSNKDAVCASCDAQQNRETLLHSFRSNKVMYCYKQDCKGPVKPKIVFFGDKPHTFSQLQNPSDEE